MNNGSSIALTIPLNLTPNLLPSSLLTISAYLTPAPPLNANLLLDRKFMTTCILFPFKALSSWAPHTLKLHHTLARCFATLWYMIFFLAPDIFTCPDCVGDTIFLLDINCITHVVLKCILLERPVTNPKSHCCPGMCAVLQLCRLPTTGAAANWSWHYHCKSVPAHWGLVADCRESRPLGIFPSRVFLGLELQFLCIYDAQNDKGGCCTSVVEVMNVVTADIPLVHFHTKDFRIVSIKMAQKLTDAAVKVKPFLFD